MYLHCTQIQAVALPVDIRQVSIATCLLQMHLFRTGQFGPCASEKGQGVSGLLSWN